MNGPAVAVPARGAALELRGVGLSYGQRRVLSDIDLAVAPGERVCLLGRNGAGKSSLLRCITGSASSIDGMVMLDGAPLAEISRRSLARRVAVVPGAVQLPFAATVSEVVSLGRVPHEHPFMGLRPADQAAVATAMTRVGITALADRAARELSLGERQLVLLALALAQAGGLLLLDEPTVHLDLTHQVAVMELLTELSERDGLTVIAVLHDLALAARFFPRIVLLDEGRVVADGGAIDVLTPERLRDVYRVPAEYLSLLVSH